jgi:hypothetical protein
MDPNDWYAAEILVKERLGDLRRTVESLRSPDGRPRPSLRVVVRTTLARLALWLLRPERRPAEPEPARLKLECPCNRAHAGEATRGLTVVRADAVKHAAAQHDVGRHENIGRESLRCRPLGPGNACIR